MEGDNIQLDPEAQRLFEQFAGVEARKEFSPSGQGADRLAQSLIKEQKRLDAVRILLIQAGHLISHYLKDGAFCSDNTAESKVFRTLSDVLVRLGGIPVAAAHP